MPIRCLRPFFVPIPDDPMGHVESDCELDSGQLFGGGPQPAGELGVLGSFGAFDQLGAAAHMREVLGSGETTAGNVGHRRIEHR